MLGYLLRLIRYVVEDIHVQDRLTKTNDIKRTIFFTQSTSRFES